MKPAVKRWIFITLMLLLIAGTTLGHAAAIPDQIQVTTANVSQAALQDIWHVARFNDKDSEQLSAPHDH